MITEELENKIIGGRKRVLTVYKGWQMSYLWLCHSTNNHGRMHLDNNHLELGCQDPT